MLRSFIEGLRLGYSITIDDKPVKIDRQLFHDDHIQRPLSEIISKGIGVLLGGPIGAGCRFSKKVNPFYPPIDHIDIKDPHA